MLFSDDFWSQGTILCMASSRFTYVNSSISFELSLRLPRFEQYFVTNFHRRMRLQHFNASIIDAKPAIHLVLFIEVFTH